MTAFYNDERWTLSKGKFESRCSVYVYVAGVSSGTRISISVIYDLRIFFIFSQRKKPILLSEIFTKHSLWHEEKSVENFKKKRLLVFTYKIKYVGKSATSESGIRVSELTPAIFRVTEATL